MSNNVANAFAGIFGFFIGLILIYVFSGIIPPIIDLIDHTVTRLIMYAGYYLVVMLVSIFLPIMLVTGANDKKIDIGG